MEESIMQIPNHIPQLVYTKHARFEQCKDMLGFIAAVPKAFLKSGCKSCEPLNETTFRTIYCYDNNHDIHLIIDSRDNTVITNYLKRADNTKARKGWFRVGVR